MNAIDKLKKTKEYKRLLVTYKQSNSPLEQIKIAKQAKTVAKVLGISSNYPKLEPLNTLTQAQADLNLPPLEFQAKHGSRLLTISGSLDDLLNVEIKALADEVINTHKRNILALAEKQVDIKP